MLEQVGLVVLGLVCSIAAASTAWNAVARRYYIAHHVAPGKIFDVAGLGMHLYCTGTGSPTIILEAGLGSNTLDWERVQPVVSKTTQVCSYDRAGLGWSAPHGPIRDANNAEAELDGLLKSAGINGPIVLVGHSLGGLYIRAYATRHREHVVGLVFVDAVTPDYLDRGSLRVRAERAESKAFSTSEYYLANLMMVIGVPRLFGACSEGSPGVERRPERTSSEETCEVDLKTVSQEQKGFRDSVHETIDTGPYGDMPILVISRDTANAAGLEVHGELAVEWAKDWDQMQEELKRLSTRSRRIIARRSGHFIQFDRPDLVNAELAAFVEQTRGETTPSRLDGSTVSE